MSYEFQHVFIFENSLVYFLKSIFDTFPFLLTFQPFPHPNLFPYRSAGVSHTNLRPKTEVHVIWRAPETSTECVVFRGTVIQSRHIWYMNENELTKKFCIVGMYFSLLIFSVLR